MKNIQHIPFQSIYREEYEVVEQKLGNLSLYPHSDQLPVLLRAIRLEFLGSLPGRIARVDKRADGFHKIILRHAALMYAATLNAARADRLRLYELPDYDLVTRVCIVQQISEDTPLGRTHRFRFYGGDDFFPEIRLSGKRIVFADHVLQRFSARVPNSVGEDITNLLIDFYGGPVITMPVGPSRAIIVSMNGSLLAFPYRESPDEYFITTCLTVNEINSLTPELLPHALNFHYDEAFTKPKLRTWLPAKLMVDYHNIWERKTQIKLPERQPLSAAAEKRVNNWHWVAHHVKDCMLHSGHGPGSQLCFADHIPGPTITEAKPGGDITKLIDEVKIYREINPQFDWDAIVAQREAEEAAARKE